MRTKSYLTGSIVNLCTLIMGLVLGFQMGSSRANDVHAQIYTPTPGQIEEVQPVFTAGSAAIGTFLAGRIATDEIAVKGFDLVKFDVNLLNLLSAKPIFSREELIALGQSSKADKVLTMKLPTPPAKPAEKKP